MNQTVVELLARNERHIESFEGRFEQFQQGQAPPVVTVCCSDSRVLQDHIFSTVDPGAVFTCANIGNRVVQRTDAGVVVSGDVLYPLLHTETSTVVVVGHTGCGAVTAAYDAVTDGQAGPAGIDHCLSLLSGPLAEGVESLPGDIDRTTAINHLVEYNVDRQVEALLDSDEVLAETTVVGVVYDFQDVYDGRRGEVHVVTVDGERDTETLRAANPAVADRIQRRWAY